MATSLRVTPKVIRGKMTEEKQSYNLKRAQELKSTMGQDWRTNSYDGSHNDQFGFKIDYGTNGVYTLYWKKEFILKCYSLTAAKEISTIMLNDIIMNKEIEL